MQKIVIPASCAVVAGLHDTNLQKAVPIGVPSCGLSHFTSKGCRSSLLWHDWSLHCSHGNSEPPPCGPSAARPACDP
eukprot:1754086-Amphidinium_carterae.1